MAFTNTNILMVNNIINRLSDILSEDFTNLGYSPTILTNLTDVKYISNLPTLVIYDGRGTFSQSSSDLLTVNREFIIELYHSRVNDSDIEREVLNTQARQMVEELTYIIMFRKRLYYNDSGLQYIDNVTIPNDNGLGMGAHRNTQYNGTQLLINVTYTIPLN